MCTSKFYLPAGCPRSCAHSGRDVLVPGPSRLEKGPTGVRRTTVCPRTSPLHTHLSRGNPEKSEHTQFEQQTASATEARPSMQPHSAETRPHPLVQPRRVRLPAPILIGIRLPPLSAPALRSSSPCPSSPSPLTLLLHSRSPLQCSNNTITQKKTHRFAPSSPAPFSRAYLGTRAARISCVSRLSLVAGEACRTRA